MNNVSDLKYRLLRLFPLSCVKSHFQPTAKLHSEIIQELMSLTDSTLIQFAFDNFGFTKQHVALYAHNENVSNLASLDFLPPEDFISRHDTPQQATVNYIYKHTFDASAVNVANNNFSRLQITFRQPIQIVIKPNVLKICLTILEKSLNSYLSDYEVFNAKRRIEDNLVIDNIVTNSYAGISGDLELIDLNRGVKALWRGDSIDAISLKFRRENSMTSEVMDEQFTFKEKYPDRFEEVMMAPLRKHVFRFLQNPDTYCDFECDPSQGTLSFNKYPKNPNQIENVVEEIIRNN